MSIENHGAGLEMPELKSQIVNGVTYKFSTSWIYELESETHWRYYWRQHHLMHGHIASDQHVLEIGVGSGFTANYLRSKGIKVTTIDIDAEKQPDIVANIVTYDFQNTYDHILAFEVFEHIPFAEFQTVLPKLARACRDYLFISLPLNRRVLFRADLQIPRLREKRIEILIPKGHISTPTHFWEIHHNGVTFALLEKLFLDVGFRVSQREKFRGIAFFALQKVR